LLVYLPSNLSNGALQSVLDLFVLSDVSVQFTSAYTMLNLSAISSFCAAWLTQEISGKLRQHNERASKGARDKE
jgi:hypothetical protein